MESKTTGKGRGRLYCGKGFNLKNNVQKKDRKDTH